MYLVLYSRKIRDFFLQSEVFPVLELCNVSYCFIMSHRLIIKCSKCSKHSNVTELFPLTLNHLTLLLLHQLTSHLPSTVPPRMTILPPRDKLKILLDKVKEFHEKFTKQYS